MEYIYSKAAVNRLKPNTVKVNGSPKSVKVTKQGVKITYANGYQETENKDMFLIHFAHRRQEEARTIPKGYLNKSHSKLWHIGTKDVSLEGETPKCNCKDFRTQQELGLKRQCCKHIYRVLQHLGYSCLAEYLEAKQTEMPSCCQECPLAEHLDRDRFACHGSILGDLVVRGHHKPLPMCHKLISKAKKKQHQE